MMRIFLVAIYYYLIDLTFTLVFMLFRIERISIIIMMKNTYFCSFLIMFFLLISIFIFSITSPIILSVFIFSIILILFVLLFPNNFFNIFCVAFVILNPLINSGIVAILILRNLPLVFDNFIRKVNFKIMIPIILIIISNIISTLKSVNIFSSFYEIIVWIVFLMIFIYASTIINNINHIKIFNSLTNGGLVLVIMIFLKFNLPNIYQYFNGLPGIRIPDTNYIAVYLLLLIPIQNYLKCTVTKKYKKQILILKNIILSYGVLLTKSRGALAILILYGIYTIFKSKNLSIKQISTIVLTILLGFWIGFETSLFEDQFNNLLTIFNGENYSNYVRINMYKDALFKMFPENPFIGVGPKNFVYTFPKYNSIDFNPSHIHNIYLQSLLETGLIGLLFLIIFFKNFIKQIFKFNKGKSKDDLKFNYFIEFIIIFAFYGLFDNSWGDSRVAFLFFIILGQISSIIKYYGKTNHANTKLNA